MKIITTKTNLKLECAEMVGSSTRKSTWKNLKEHKDQSKWCQLKDVASEKTKKKWSYQHLKREKKWKTYLWYINQQITWNELTGKKITEREREAQYLKGHKKTRKRICLNNTKKYSFELKGLDDEIVGSVSVYSFAAKVDNRRYGRQDSTHCSFPVCYN